MGASLGIMESNELIARKSIPKVDMGLFLRGSFEQKKITAKKFGNALQKIGFVAVTNIGINANTINKAYALAENYFNLAEDIKLKTKTADGHRGFTPFGTEHAKYTSIMDLKEFYQTTGPTQPDELWPALFGFKEIMTSLYLELETCMKYCLQATAMHLGYQDAHEQNILSDLLGSGKSVMRILHYPPVIPEQCPPGAVRSAPHEDLGVMTLIPRATRPGLQIKTHQGEWLDVVVPDDAVIINSGDVLSYMTNGIIPSTTHRVINPPVEDHSHRYSIPFFGNFAFDAVLRVLDKCKTNADELHEETTFGEFLHQRYQKIGLIS